MTFDWSDTKYFIEGEPADGPPKGMYVVRNGKTYQWRILAELSGDKVLWESYSLYEVTGC